MFLRVGAVNGFLKLYNDLPDELISLPSDEYYDLIAAIGTIELGLEEQFRTTARVDALHPVAPALRKSWLVLSKLKDEVPSTSHDLSFISDAVLREMIGVEISAVRIDLHSGEWKGATIIAGSCCEALLLFGLQHREGAAPGTIAAVINTITWKGKAPNPSDLTDRSSDVIRKHVKPHIGNALIQRLRPADLADLYAKLSREGRSSEPPIGLAAYTVGHVHRLIHRALGHARQWGLVGQNVAEFVDPPRVSAKELNILRVNDIKAILQKLQGRSLYMIAATALATGMRRGELLALRWHDVDLERRVEQSLETTTRSGPRFKAPKTKYGRRNDRPPRFASSAAKGASKDAARATSSEPPDDALVFATWDGRVRHPNAVSNEWSDAMAAIGHPSITLHSLRHTHASQLIASGLDVLTISRRLGHGSPAITLDVDGHLFSNTDERAAQVIEATLAATRTEWQHRWGF